jgi:uncharacterized protein YjbI with pentapeptide repeats
MNQQPRISDDPLYVLLREGNVDIFNEERRKQPAPDLTGCDFRGVDLQGLEADGLNLSNCYFRQADLRGVDFSKARLEGASLHGARIAGAYFPPELSADEIHLSVVRGTRMRYR